MMLLVVVGVVLLATATLVHPAGLALGLALRALVLLGFVAALVPAGVIRSRDLQELRRILRGAPG